MTLIKSISGIRGTIGGRAGDTLNPLDIVKFVSAYATFIARKHPGKKLKMLLDVMHVSLVQWLRMLYAVR